MLIQYTPVKTAESVVHAERYNDSGKSVVQRLCEIDGLIYAAADDSVDVSEFDSKLSVSVVNPGRALRAQIKAKSPHCALIKHRAHQRIEGAYPIEDQRMLERLAIAGGSGLKTLSAGQTAAISQFNAVNDEALSWAAEQYAMLGL